MLPCSNFERFLSKWLLTAIIFPIALTLYFYLFSSIALILNVHMFGDFFSSLLNIRIYETIGHYIILQSVFLLGAITFKNMASIKTLLIIGVLAGTIALYSLALTLSMFCPECIAHKLLPALLPIFNIAYTLICFVLAPFCWFLTYLKIKELELK